MDIDVSKLPKIDLLIGGSPCQGFSFAGKMLNFDDHRSALFWEFARILKYTDPTYFLLENVIRQCVKPRPLGRGYKHVVRCIH